MMTKKGSLIAIALVILCIINPFFLQAHASTNNGTQTPDPCNPNSLIVFVTVSQSGKYVAADWKHSVRVWDLETGSPVSTLTAATMQYDDEILISPNDKYVLTGGKQGVAILWDLVTSMPIHTFKHTGHVHSIAFLSDEKTILSSDQNEAILWDIQKGNKIRSFSVGTIQYSQVSSNGKYLLLNSYPNIVVFDVATGKTLHTFEGTHQYGQYMFSPDGTLIITKHKDEYRVWDVQSHKQIQVIRPDTDILPFRLSPNGKFWSSFEKDEAIRVFNTQTGEQLHRFVSKASPPRVNFFPDNKRILVSKAWIDDQDWDAGGLYGVYDLETGAELHTISIKDSVSGIVHSLITPDGKYLLVSFATYNDSGIRLWDVRTGKLIRRFC